MMMRRHTGVLLRRLVDGALLCIVARQAQALARVPCAFDLEAAARLAAGVLRRCSGRRVGIRHEAQHIAHAVSEQAQVPAQCGARLPRESGLARGDRLGPQVRIAERHRVVDVVQLGERRRAERAAVKQLRGHVVSGSPDQRKTRVGRAAEVGVAVVT